MQAATSYLCLTNRRFNFFDMVLCVMELRPDMIMEMAFAIKQGVLRSGTRFMIRTGDDIEGRPAGIKKTVYLKHREAAEARYSHKTAGGVDLGLIRTIGDKRGTPLGASSLKEVLGTTFKHLGKNGHTVSYRAHAMAGPKLGAVHETDKLERSYKALAKRAGWKVDDSGFLTHLIPPNARSGRR